MRILTDWLAEFTEIPEDTEELAHRLTDIGLEVEEVIELDSQLENVVVAKTLQVQRHPERNDLKICEISSGDRQQQVVTTAPGVLPNRHYLWAAPGAKLAGEKIEKMEFAGTESAGMLCSSRELGLTTEAHTLLEIPGNIPPGTDAAEVLELEHPLLELDLTPNRADCLSHLGVARDFAAAEKLDLKDPRPKNISGNAESATQINIEAPERCWAYTGVPIKNINVGPANFNIQKRILKMGLRPLNNIVDITNYTLFEVGHPLHPFDADKLKYPVVVREAKNNEQLTTLDDENQRLTEDDLVIADSEKPVAMAGIMGGKSTQVSRSTDNLLLEGAYFEPTGIRRSAANHKLHTEASHRFERGTDSENYHRCLARCVELIENDAQQDADITVCQPVETRKKNKESTQIFFSSASFKKLIGYDPGQATVLDTFKRLGLQTEEKNDQLTVSSPTWRTDLEFEEDLIEEIVRLNGYEEIPTEFPEINIAHTPHHKKQIEEKIVKFLAARGFTENINFSFVSKDDHRFNPGEEPLKLSNPLAQHQSTMRQSLLDGLYESLAQNFAGGEKNIRLFEVGRIYPAEGEKEPLHVGILALGQLNKESWDNTGREFDFYDLKGLVSALFDYLGYENIEFAPANQPGFKRERCGIITVENNEAGKIGEIVDTNIDSNLPIWGAELDFSKLEAPQPTNYTPYPDKPTVKRDLDLILKIDQPVGPVKETIRSTARWLENITIFDFYRGEPLASDEKSVSFNLEFRAEDRTLNDSEVNEVQDEILTILHKKYGARLREG
ncbi:MAG: phenylalanine--tRNA ligase subunit beta [bacterium]